MAYTRTELRTAVTLNTGRDDKDALINSQADNAIKLAMIKHPFKDAEKICDDVTITEDATSVDISALTQSSVSIGTMVDVLTARIVEVDGPRNFYLRLKNKQWWDKVVVNSDDNFKGWPIYGYHSGTNVILDRPVIDGLALRLRVSTIPSYTDDSSECPIAMLDLFVEQFVTAMVFLSLGMQDKYVSWYIMALGRRYDVGVVGGSLLAALQQDRADTAEESKVERVGDVYGYGYDNGYNGIAILNNTPGMPTFGQTIPWY